MLEPSHVITYNFHIIVIPKYWLSLITFILYIFHAISIPLFQSYSDFTTFSPRFLTSGSEGCYPASTSVENATWWRWAVPSAQWRRVQSGSAPRSCWALSRWDGCWDVGSIFIYPYVILNVDICIICWDLNISTRFSIPLDFSDLKKHRLSHGIFNEIIALVGEPWEHRPFYRFLPFSCQESQVIAATAANSWRSRGVDGAGEIRRLDGSSSTSFTGWAMRRCRQRSQVDRFMQRKA